MGQTASSTKTQAASGMMPNTASASFHADPALTGMPAVNPALSAPRGGDHTSTILIKDGRGEDPRPNLDHLSGVPDSTDHHAVPLNPRYMANLQYRNARGTFS